MNNYTEQDMSKDGILKCQNGNMNYQSYGDYYFVEAYAMRTYGFDRIW